MVVERLNARHARVKLPKLGWVRFRLSRPLDGALIRSATLTREGRHWYVSFLVDDGQSTPAVHARRVRRSGWIAVWWWRWRPVTASGRPGLPHRG